MSHENMNENIKTRKTCKASEHKTMSSGERIKRKSCLVRGSNYADEIEKERKEKEERELAYKKQKEERLQKVRECIIEEEKARLIKIYEQEEKEKTKKLLEEEKKKRKKLEEEVDSNNNICMTTLLKIIDSENKEKRIKHTTRNYDEICTKADDAIKKKGVEWIEQKLKHEKYDKILRPWKKR